MDKLKKVIIILIILLFIMGILIITVINSQMKIKNKEEINNQANIETMTVARIYINRRL